MTLGTGAGASSVQYAHNALGLRVFKTDVLAGASTTNTNPTSKAGQPRITLLGDEDEEQDQPGTNSPSAQGTQGASGPGSLLQNAKNFWLRLWSPQTDSTQAQGRAFVYAEDGSLLGEYPMEANPATHRPTERSTSGCPRPMARCRLRWWVKAGSTQCMRTT